MKLTSVESSHIAAIGYLEDERVLLVRYKDGSLYAQPGWNSVAWDQLQRAQSKGKAIKACAVPMILITKGEDPSVIVSYVMSRSLPKGVMTTEPELSAVRPRAVRTGASVAEPGDNAAPSPGPLNVIDEEVDKCCRVYLNQMFGAPFANSRQLTCNSCGQEFRAEMVGPVRHWRIIPQVHIVRPK